MKYRMLSIGEESACIGIPPVPQNAKNTGCGKKLAIMNISSNTINFMLSTVAVGIFQRGG